MAKNRLKQLREKYNLSLKEVSEASTKSGFDVLVPYFEGVAETRYPATTAAKS